MSIATQVKRLQDVRNQIRAKMVSLGLSTKTDLLQDLANDLDGVAFRGDASTTLSTSTRSKTLDAGYYTGGTIKVPSDYFPVNSTNTTATASDVLSGKTFVSTSGSTVTGTIATASSSDVSGDVKGADPNKITLTAAKTLGSSSTTATTKAIVTKGLYTGSSNIEKDLTSKTLTATAEATLANTNGAVSITAGTSDIVKTSTGDYSNGFITKVTVSPTPSEEQTATPTSKVQTVDPTPGKLLSKVTVNAIPSPYFNTSGVTATAGTVLKDYKFVNSSGTTVTGTIATATSGNVSGSVSGDNPGKITLTAADTLGSSSTTATASAIITKGLYTGSSNIKADLTSKTFTATAEATLAGTNGAIELTAGTSAFTKTSTADYSNGFITSVKVNPTPSQSKVVTPTMAGQTVSPDPDSGKLLSSVTVNAVPYFSVTLPSSMWGNSGSNVTAGKYYYNVSNEHITANNNLYVMPNNASAAQSFGVYAYSQSRTSGAKTGALQFRAMERPTSDLTYTIYYLN